MLPTGQVLYTISQIGDTQYYVYNPLNPTPLAAAIPTITNISGPVSGVYTITGTNFGGINEGATYGDDWQMSTNFPLVRLVNGTNVYYAKTTNWSTRAIQQGVLPTTVDFTLPAGLPVGSYQLYVVVNGVPSAPFQFIVPCVAGNTKILMASGEYRRIDQLKRGDLIAVDKSLDKTMKVARINKDGYEPHRLIEIMKFSKGCLGKNMPCDDVIITGGHAIFYQGARREAREFKDIKGVKYYPSIRADEILPIDELGNCCLYDIQFEDDGYYFASGMKIQSRSPFSIFTPLPKDLYFDQSLYTEERTYNSLHHDIPFAKGKVSDMSISS